MMKWCFMFVFLHFKTESYTRGRIQLQHIYGRFEYFRNRWSTGILTASQSCVGFGVNGVSKRKYPVSDSCVWSPDFRTSRLPSSNQKRLWLLLVFIYQVIFLSFVTKARSSFQLDRCSLCKCFLKALYQMEAWAVQSDGPGKCYI